MMFQLVSYIMGIFILLLATFRSTENTTFRDSINQFLLWAPYSLQCYFGIRPRYINDTSFIMGLMWFDTNILDIMINLRHQVNMDDNLEKFSRIVYDSKIGVGQNQLLITKIM